MSNIVSIQVDNLAAVLDIYNQIKVYKADNVAGPYVEVSNSSTRIILNTMDTLYSFTDSIGINTDFYKTAYFNSINNIESTLSTAVAATTALNQLRENMQVVITLSNTIKDSTGNSLGEQVYFFTTTYNPLYSSIRKVRLEVGVFLKNIDDDTINFAIFEASLMANEINWVKGVSSDFFKFARREWTTCKAAEILLHNIVGTFGLRSKKLDNLEIQYDPKMGATLLNKIQDCLSRWEAEVISGGAAVQKPAMFVKGQFDIDAPHVGRMWEKGPPGLFRAPGSNLRYRPAFSRRYIGGWIGRGNGFFRGRGGGHGCG